MKVGVKALKTLKVGRILIEACGEEVLNTLGRAINTKFGENLEILEHNLRKPRLIFYKVPKDVSTDIVTTFLYLKARTL